MLTVLASMALQRLNARSNALPQLLQFILYGMNAMKLLLQQSQLAVQSCLHPSELFNPLLYLGCLLVVKALLIQRIGCSNIGMKLLEREAQHLLCPNYFFK